MRNAVERYPAPLSFSYTSLRFILSARLFHSRKHVDIIYQIMKV
jgi:hypothetical protein